ncbi:MAG TPA: hypothetical protein VKX49_23965 [Bryobacteraceae bacterium]|nr:hypothetical protein [Bryobacteraceae bacterium]
MDERTNQVISEIFEQRQRLGDNVAELEQKLRNATSWRAYFGQNPWAMLGLAAAGGFLLSALFTRWD